MSLGYAEKLSFREDLGGQLGAPELFDTAAEVEAKVERLAELVRGGKQGIWFGCVRMGHNQRSCNCCVLLARAGATDLDLTSSVLLPPSVRLQVQQARRIIAFTGAGISTACGIPDFRGPNGIWTLQRAGQPLPRPKVSFTHAKPSLTHQVQPHAGRWLPLCSCCARGCMLEGQHMCNLRRPPSRYTC